MLAKPEYFSPPNEVCCWRGAVKTGQAPRWSCWPEQVLAGAGAGRGSCWPGQVLARAPRRSAIWKMMAGAPWRRGWRGAVKTGQAPRWSCWPEQVLAGVPRRSAIWKRLAGAPWRSAIGKQLWAEVPMRQHREETAGQAAVEEQGRHCRRAKAASATSGRQVFPRRLPASGRQVSCAQIGAGGD